MATIGGGNANGNSKGSGVIPSRVWSCCMCTLDNDMNNIKCAACDTPRDTTSTSTSGVSSRSLTTTRRSITLLNTNVLTNTAIVGVILHMLPFEEVAQFARVNTIAHTSSYHHHTWLYYYDLTPSLPSPAPVVGHDPLHCRRVFAKWFAHRILSNTLYQAFTNN
jgi:hypothetical protein